MGICGLWLSDTFFRRWAQSLHCIWFLFAFVLLALMAKWCSVHLLQIQHLLGCGGSEQLVRECSDECCSLYSQGLLQCCRSFHSRPVARPAQLDDNIACAGCQRHVTRTRDTWHV